ncbi:MAG: DUF3108 domain-containing protein [Candidatus Firestonebacteria bacterium]
MQCKNLYIKAAIVSLLFFLGCGSSVRSGYIKVYDVTGQAENKESKKSEDSTDSKTLLAQNTQDKPTIIPETKAPVEVAKQEEAIIIDKKESSPQLQTTDIRLQTSESKEKSLETTTIAKQENPVVADLSAKKTTVKDLSKRQVKIQNFAFGSGEKLTFAIQYMKITAGIATMEVREITNTEGKDAYHIVTTAKSLPFFSTFHKVDDRVETYIDVYSFLPIRLEQYLVEGTLKKNSNAYFDNEKNTVTEENKIYNAPDNVHDILSCFFYFRTQKVEIGKDIPITVYSEGEFHNLKVQIINKEVVKVPAGKFNTLVVKPIMNFESIFKQEGDITIWVTDDVRHIPVKMAAKAFLVGAINVVLTEGIIIDKGQARKINQ